MSDFVELVLTTLTSQGKFDSLNLSEKLSIDHQKVVGAVKSLQSLGDVISTEQTSQTRWQLTPEGQEVMERGSHEAVVFRNVPEGGIRQDDLMNLVGSSYGKIGFSKAMSSNWISIDKKADGGPRVLRKVETIEDHVQKQCRLVRDGQIDQLTDQQKTELKKRKLISEIKLTSYVVSTGSNFTTNIEKQETDLTQEMITSGAWKTKQFKAYNFSAKGLDPHGGHLHPLLKVRTQFRQIFLEMGFTEMPTNNFVESSFWNFDALFQPQQHPARDAHDTFFVSDPEHARDFPMEYMERVKKVHSVGGYGSLGYRYNWSELEASKNIMRTHTTAVSARMLYQLAIQPTFTPSKFFSIDRVFRNETLDATHLAEFHQIEGLVADYGLTLGDLMGYIQEFFKKYGIQKLKFKPAYNPYTEPSMEVFSYHEGLKKWVEIGNSGVFRPELLLPMNLPPQVSVIAWGLSLERPTMIKYGIQNIRDLFGPKVDLQKIYDSPICRLGSDSPITLMHKFPKESKRPPMDDRQKTENSKNFDASSVEMRQDQLINRLNSLIQDINQINETSQPVNQSVKQVSNPIPSETNPGNLNKLAKTTKPELPSMLTNLRNEPLGVHALIPLERLSTGDLNLTYNHLSATTVSCTEKIVIHCDPIYVPLSLIIILKDIVKYDKPVRCSIEAITLQHLDGSQLSKLKNIFPSANSNYDDIQPSKVHIVWQDLGPNPRDMFMVINNDVTIKGETTIAKWLPNLLIEESSDDNSSLEYFYNTLDNTTASKIDELIDECVTAYFPYDDEGSKKFLNDLNNQLTTSSGPYVINDHVTLADVIIWSVLSISQKNSKKQDWTEKVAKWMSECSKMWEKFAQLCI